MAEIDFYYPFDSIDGDRKTTAATERRFFGALFSDGVVGSGAFQLTQVSAGVYSIGAGVAIVGGAIGGIVNAKRITAKPALGAVLHIVLRLDTSSEARKITLEAVSSLEAASAAQLEQGGVYDLPLYSVEGLASGSYGLLDQRKYCTSFDNVTYSAEFKAMLTGMKSEGVADLDALRTNFNAAIDAANVETAGLYGAAGRQGFINPTFLVNQRGKASYGITSGSAYTYDHWKAAVTGRALSSAMTLQTAQDGMRHRLRIETKPFADGTASAARAGLIQNIEGGVRTFCGGGRSFTVSFDARATEACRIGVDALQFAVSGGSGVLAGAQTVNVATGWQRFSLTFKGSVSPEAVNDVLQIGFYVAWMGYDRYSGGDQAGGHTIYIANMQINEGTSALPCYVKPYADELEACQRYYVGLGYVSLSVGATLASSNQVITNPLPITRRLYRMPDATPTDRANVSGKASVEIAAGGWRNGLACVISNNSADAPVFVVTNTDASAVTRVNFNSLALDAEIND